jgi:hypothetical protein
MAALLGIFSIVSATAQAAEPIRLRFELKDADLYALWFE